MKKYVLLTLALSALIAGCGRSENKAVDTLGDRLVVISPIYNEIIWALGVENRVVGVDLSSTYPDGVKQVQTVGYHRALSAEGILSLHPTAILTSEGNIGPPQVVEQINSLNIPIKSFNAKNDSIEGTKALLREMGEFFGKEERAEELCERLDAKIAVATEALKQFPERPRVAVIHFGRASNVYLVVGKGSGGDGGGASKMVELAGGEMAVETPGMQRMASPEILAQANPDVILVTDYGFDRLGGDLEQVKELPGVATSNAAKNNRIYRIEENQFMYFSPRSGENIVKLMAFIHR